LRLGHVDLALEALDQSLSLEPDADQARSSRALVLGRLQRHAEALRDISRAVELQPRNESHQHNLGVTLTALGRHHAAIITYRRLLALNPKSAGTHNNLAWLLATSEDATVRDGPAAVSHAQQALSAADNPAWISRLRSPNPATSTRRSRSRIGRMRSLARTTSPFVHALRFIASASPMRPGIEGSKSKTRESRDGSGTLTINGSRPRLPLHPLSSVSKRGFP